MIHDLHPIVPSWQLQWQETMERSENGFTIAERIHIFPGNTPIRSTCVCPMVHDPILRHMFDFVSHLNSPYVASHLPVSRNIVFGQDSVHPWHLRTLFGWSWVLTVFTRISSTVSGRTILVPASRRISSSVLSSVAHPDVSSLHRVCTIRCTSTHHFEPPHQFSQSLRHISFDHGFASSMGSTVFSRSILVFLRFSNDRLRIPSDTHHIYYTTFLSIFHPKVSSFTHAFWLSYSGNLPEDPIHHHTGITLRSKSKTHSWLELTIITTGTWESSVSSDGSYSSKVRPESSSSTRCIHTSTTRTQSPS